MIVTLFRPLLVHRTKFNVKGNTFLMWWRNACHKAQKPSPVQWNVRRKMYLSFCTLIWPTWFLTLTPLDYFRSGYLKLKSICKQFGYVERLDCNTRNRDRLQCYWYSALVDGQCRRKSRSMYYWWKSTSKWYCFRCLNLGNLPIISFEIMKKKINLILFRCIVPNYNVSFFLLAYPVRLFGEPHRFMGWS